MKTINLYFDFEFTSLSPDAQPISLGIVSDEVEQGVWLVQEDKLPEGIDKNDIAKYCADNIGIAEKITKNAPKSFYAEFSDFDINRCDDWVKENVVNKLKMYNGTKNHYGSLGNNDYELYDDTPTIINYLKEWLSQFSDYQIQFIGDCCTWDWWFMVQLLAEWEENERLHRYPDEIYKGEWYKIPKVRISLPKLPDNISPVPFDLNDLIAIKKGITPKEAFDLNREELAFGSLFLVPDKILPPDISNEELLKLLKENYGGIIMLPEDSKIEKVVPGENNKHNALWDAKVIKKIYQKLK